MSETETEPRTSETDTPSTTTAGETDEEIREEWRNYEFAGPAKIAVEDLDVYYGDDHALKGVSMDIPEESVTALIGPSGCGKSTFLRCLNRMNDRIKAAEIDGSVQFDGEEIYQDRVDLVELRKRVGMVFQAPNPFPKSVRENITYGPRKHGDIDTGLLPACSPASPVGETKKRPRISSSARSSRRRCGTRSATASTTTPSASRVGNSSDSASRAVSPSTPR